MAAWTSAEVILECPELGTTPPIAPATFDYFIAKAERQMNTSLFGARVVEAGALLTAHMMLRAGYGGGASSGGGAGAVGAISQMTVGQVSVSYSGAGSAGGSGGSAQEQELSTTRPGAQYLAIVESLVATPMVLHTGLMVL